MLWTVLGFSADDVAGASHDPRMSLQCVEAWRSEGCPDDFEIRRAAGDRVHVIYWYVSRGAARALDKHGVGWRRFVIGLCRVAPTGASSVIGNQEHAT